MFGLRVLFVSVLGLFLVSAQLNEELSESSLFADAEIARFQDAFDVFKSAGDVYVDNNNLQDLLIYLGFGAPEVVDIRRDVQVFTTNPHVSFEEFVLFVGALVQKERNEGQSWSGHATEGTKEAGEGGVAAHASWLGRDDQSPPPRRQGKGGSYRVYRASDEGIIGFDWSWTCICLILGLCCCGLICQNSHGSQGRKRRGPMMVEPMLGARVETQYLVAEGGNGRWYQGRVVNIANETDPAVVTIEYDDGDSWTGPFTKGVYLMCTEQGREGQSKDEHSKVEQRQGRKERGAMMVEPMLGARVETKYTIAEGGDGRWYQGRVVNIAQGKVPAVVTIEYDDGDRWVGPVTEGVHLICNEQDQWGTRLSHANAWHTS